MHKKYFFLIAVLVFSLGASADNDEVALQPFKKGDLTCFANDLDGNNYVLNVWETSIKATPVKVISDTELAIDPSRFDQTWPVTDETNKEYEINRKGATLKATVSFLSHTQTVALMLGASNLYYAGIGGFLVTNNTDTDHIMALSVIFCN